jgi:EAL domain-containing protein (putative c-di-GMP-specific phosphodiesterase class I)
VADDIALWNQYNGSPISMWVASFAREFEIQTLEMFQDLMHSNGQTFAELGLCLDYSDFAHSNPRALSLIRAMRARGSTVISTDLSDGLAGVAAAKSGDCDIHRIGASLITDLPQNSVDIAIVRSVVSIARATGTLVAAEGVTNPQQCGFLQSIRVSYMSGPLLGEPMGGDRIAELLAAGPIAFTPTDSASHSPAG